MNRVMAICVCVLLAVAFAAIADSPSGSPRMDDPVLTLPELVLQDRKPEYLSADSLVEEVLARNPSLAQMEAAWRAASARYPQVRSLDDPMLMGGFAPPSFRSSMVEPAYRIEVSQKFPFPGKLRLRGQGALAEASAAGNDYEDMKLQLTEAARQAFYDYFLVQRTIAINEEGLRLLDRFRGNVEARVRANLVPAQDLVQTEVEIGRQTERAITLKRTQAIAIARINTLKSLPTSAQMPPPPERLVLAQEPPSLELLQSVALNQRPDLRALENRVAAEQSALALAYREYLPDLEASGIYDTIMGNGPARDLAPQVGLRINIPLRLKKRNAAVAEAAARLDEKRAELAQQLNQVNFQVQEAYEQVREAQRIVNLYEKTILPAAKRNVELVAPAYVTAKIPVLSLIQAERDYVNMHDRFYEATADYFRRLATLERVIGGPLPTPAKN